MAYVYLKKKPAKKSKPAAKNYLSFIFLVIGILSFLFVLYPLTYFQWGYSRRFQPILSPLSVKFYNNEEGIMAEAVDFTQLSNWFVQNNGQTAAYSQELLSETDHRSYLLSIPKLGIKDVEVTIGGKDLKKSIIHYPQTALPGQRGNAVIFGHSVLPQFFNPKSYLTVFSTLFKLIPGDQIIVYFDRVHYTYLVEDVFEVKATRLFYFRTAL